MPDRSHRSRRRHLPPDARRRRRRWTIEALALLWLVACGALIAGWPVQAIPYPGRVGGPDTEFRLVPAADWSPARPIPAATTTVAPPPPAPLPPSLPSTDSCGPRPKPSGGTWECTLDEEFDEGALDRHLWIPQQTATSGFHSGPECLVDSPNNVSVGGGVLRLTVRREPRAFDCSSRHESFTTRYTGGQVSTYERFSQAYGRFEIRASFPGAGTRGVQTSLWLWPDRPRRDRWEEIDLAEFFSRFGDRVAPFVHYENRTNVTNDYCMIGDPGRFHTYALEWTPETLSFIYDGQTCLVHHIQPTSYGRAFDRPFIIALSQVLGVTTNSFDPATTPLPATAEIDYVRVWR